MCCVPLHQCYARSKTVRISCCYNYHYIPIIIIIISVFACWQNFKDKSFFFLKGGNVRSVSSLFLKVTTDAVWYTQPCIKILPHGDYNVREASIQMCDHFYFAVQVYCIVARGVSNTSTVNPIYINDSRLWLAWAAEVLWCESENKGKVYLIRALMD